MQNKDKILFDGSCGFCNYSVKFIRKRTKKNYTYIPLESDEGITIKKTYNIDPEIDSVILIKNGKVYTKSRAGLEIVRSFKRFWPLLYGFIIIPWFIRDYIYDFIARNRHKIIKEDNSCDIHLNN